MTTSINPLNPTSFSILFLCFHSEHRTCFLHCLYSTFFHIPVSPPPSPIRLLSPLLKKKKKSTLGVTNGLCLAKSMVNSLSSSCLSYQHNTLDHSQLILKILFHSFGFPTDSLTASSQTPFLDPPFLPDLYILGWPRALKPSFLHSLPKCDLAQHTQLKISIIYLLRLPQNKARLFSSLQHYLSENQKHPSPYNLFHI